MTGVVIGVNDKTTAEHAEKMLAALKQAFPGVVFALVAGCTAIATFETPEDEA